MAMHVWLQKFIGWIIASLSAVVSIIKLYIYIVGLSTTFEDSAALPDKGRVVLTFIADQPAVVFYGFFIALGCLGLWLALRNQPLVRNDGTVLLSNTIPRAEKTENSTDSNIQSPPPERNQAGSNDFILTLGETFVLLDKHFKYPHFVDSLMTYLSDGRIIAFGEPMLGSWENSPNHGLGPEEQIGSDYWKQCKIDWNSVNGSDRTYSIRGGISYAKLRFVRSDLMEAFFGQENNWKS